MSLPGKVHQIVHFLERFELILDTWSKDSRWPLTKISEFAAMDLPSLVLYFGHILDRHMDIHDPINKRDCEKVYSTLRSRMQHQIQAQKEEKKLKSKIAEQQYQDLKQKLIATQQQNNFYKAFRSLCYFFGKYQDDLSPAIKIDICNECLRFGERANVNRQELAHWLRTSINYCITHPYVGAFDDAIDFIETYGHLFTTEKKGLAFINAMLSHIQTIVYDFESSKKLENVAYAMNVPAIGQPMSVDL